MDQAHYVKNSAFHKDLGRHISFPSRSDAMIASLALSHKLGSALMDIIFLIIHDRSFNPSEMTLRKTEDIYIHLFKRSFVEAGIESRTPEIHNQMIKSATTHSTTTRKSIPPIILDAVISWVDESIEDRDTYLLRNLAFVQRRYLQPACRALGRAVYLSCGDREMLLKRCLANPLAGPWTRQLSLGIYIPDDATAIMNTLNLALTKRITGLRKLVWAFPNSVLSTDLLENTFTSLGSVSELVLTLKRKSTDKRVSASHYRSIISMPSLRTLVLQHWDIPSMLDVPCEGLPPWFTQLKPFPSFKMLRLYKPCFRFQGWRSKLVDLHLFWTRDSHGEFFLSMLSVKFHRDMEREELHEVCGCLLPLIHRLEVLCLDELAHDKEEYLLRFLDYSSKTLRKLSFNSRYCPSEAVLRSVSQTIMTLSLHLGDCYTSESIKEWNNIDGWLHGLISSDIWPELNTLNICFSYGSSNEVTLQFNRLSQTKALCKERDIEMTLTKPRILCSGLDEAYENGIFEGLKTEEFMDTDLLLR